MVQKYKEGEPGPSTVALAEQEGISIEEAVKRYEWQTPFSQATSAIEEAMPKAYAAAEITGHYTATVTFAGDVPAGVSKYFKDIPEHVDIKLIGGAARALVGLRAEMEALSHKLGKDPDVDQALAAFDTDSGVIEIQMKPRVNTKSAQSELRAKVAAYKAEGSRTPVELTFTDESLGETRGEGRGGSYIDTLNSEAGCTTAFVVKNSSNRRGLLTADHCAVDPWMTLRNPNSSEETLVTRQARTGTPGVDLAWFDLGGPVEWTATNLFHADYHLIRDVVNAASPAPGQKTERFGRITGHRYFYTVYKKDFCFIDPIKGEYCRLTTTKNAETSEIGDSGGPWFNNHTAHGVHTHIIKYRDPDQPGTPYIWRDTFTVIYALNATLGLGLYYG